MCIIWKMRNNPEPIASKICKHVETLAQQERKVLLFMKGKHFTEAERGIVQHKLDEGASFAAAAEAVGKSPTAVAREVQRNSHYERSGAFGRRFNNCLNRFGCGLTMVCTEEKCPEKKNRRCATCGSCINVCEHFQEEKCEKLQMPPYVCNGCVDRRKCTLEKCIYKAEKAQKVYEEILRESRMGPHIDEGELAYVNQIVSPLLRQGQSPYAIHTNHVSEMNMSVSSLYRRIRDGSFDAGIMDLPATVQRKPRRPKGGRPEYKVDRHCLEGRRYEDYTTFCSETHPFPIVEMDTVIGNTAGKALLTIHNISAQFLMILLLEHKNAHEVEVAFDVLWDALGPDVFRRMFPAILTDNGSEFSDPRALELDPKGKPRTRIFFCHPLCSNEKAEIEQVHTLMRRILPKGTSFDDLTQEDISLVASHVNSYVRRKSGGMVPYDVLMKLMPEAAAGIARLGIRKIPADDVILRPELLRK